MWVSPYEQWKCYLNLTFLENISVVPVFPLLLRKISIEGHRQKDLAIMYWFLEKHQNPVTCHFIAASKTCRTEPLKPFHIFLKWCAKSFHKKSQFYSNFKNRWIAQNSFPLAKKLTKVSRKKNAKTISNFGFRTFYSSIPHILLIPVLHEMISFVFSYKKRTELNIQSHQFTGHPKVLTKGSLHCKV